MNIWVLRPNIDDKNRTDYFIENQIISIGWGDLGTLEGKDKEEIANNFKDEYNQSGQKAALNIGMINRFVNEFEVGDLVFVPDGDHVNVAEISSNYFYNENDSVLPHMREVEFVRIEILKDDLPDNLQSSLKSRMGIYSITKDHDYVAYWLNMTAKTKEEKMLDYTNKIKAFIGLEAIKYVGTYSQTHYDVVEFSLSELISAEYKEMVRDIVKRYKNIILEVNNEEKFEEFYDLLRGGGVEEVLISRRNDIIEDYSLEILKALEEMDEDLVSKKLFEVKDLYYNEISGTVFSNVMEKVNEEKSQLLKEAHLNATIRLFNKMGIKKERVLEALENLPE